MPQLGHRDVSLTTVALTDDRVTIELIADGIHVHPRMIDLACRAKPRARVIGISDAATGAGLADGQYRVGNDVVEIKDGCCRRVSDGRLAGTCFTLDKALSNFRRFCPSLPEQDAVASYSLYAAQSVGLLDRGILQPGKRADIAVFDAQGTVVLTIVNGRVVYDRDKVVPAPASPAVPEPAPAA
jgi:N-acetylglucosamine-6-phosphate deacetylase